LKYLKILFLLIWNRFNITCSNRNRCFRNFPSDMFRGVLNTKNHPCSRSNMVEMVCFLRWYYNRKYKYRHRRTLLQIKLLFSEFYHSRHVFFTRIPPFNALPDMFLTLYSSIIIIQLKCRFVACAWSQSLHQKLHFHVSAATGKQNGGRNNDKSASLPDESRLGRKHLWQVLYKDCSWRRFLDIDRSETRIVCGGHACKWIGTKWAIFIEDLP
jgi:hypothetical protein